MVDDEGQESGAMDFEDEHERIQKANNEKQHAARARLRSYLEQISAIDDAEDPCEAACKELDRLAKAVGRARSAFNGAELQNVRLGKLAASNPQNTLLRWTRMYRSGWCAALREALKLHMDRPDISTMEILERGIYDVDAHGLLPTNLEHVAVELEKWIELAHEVVDPAEPCSYDDLRDALRAQIAPNEVDG